MQVNPKQLETILSKTIPAGKPVLVTGAPGIGKTCIIEAASVAAGNDLLISHPVTADPTDAKGLPWPDAGGKKATFLPFGDLATAMEAKMPLTWFLDDLGQAGNAVQASFMQLILARRVNGHKLPDCVTFVAATNRRVDRAGVSGILEPVKSRFSCILELVPDLDSWCNWGVNNGVSYTLLAFMRYKPDLLCKFEATADLTNSPVPRTWGNLSQLEALGLPSAEEVAAFAGAVGEGAALEYLAFRKMANSLGNLDGILMDPARAPIPKKLDELYATAIGLAARANENNFDRIVTYATRLATDADRGEFGCLLVRDSARRDGKVMYTNAWVKMNSGPLGQLLSGKE